MEDKATVYQAPGTRRQTRWKQENYFKGEGCERDIEPSKRKEKK